MTAVDHGLFNLWSIDGFMRRVPRDWVFPNGAVINQHRYWHHWDEVKRISPLKLFQKKDVSWKKGRWVKNLEEVQSVCKQLDVEAKAKNLFRDPSNPTRIEVDRAFYAVKHVFGIGNTTHTGRKRNVSTITLPTILRERRRVR